MFFDPKPGALGPILILFLIRAISPHLIGPCWRVWARAHRCPKWPSGGDRYRQYYGYISNFTVRQVSHEFSYHFKTYVWRICELVSTITTTCGVFYEYFCLYAIFPLRGRFSTKICCVMRPRGVPRGVEPLSNEKCELSAMFGEQV